MLCCRSHLFCSIIWRLRSTRVSLFFFFSFSLVLIDWFAADAGLKTLFIISAVVMILICIVGILTACQVCHPICEFLVCLCWSWLASNKSILVLWFFSSFWFGFGLSSFGFHLVLVLYLNVFSQRYVHHFHVCAVGCHHGANHLHCSGHLRSSSSRSNTQSQHHLLRNRVS